ncbi:DUF4373 domain-containing protein [Bacteroides fragilis]|jgi:hypothetical protein|uniref:DUF4373 domain-containing protein n=1 Tax=Bacteroides fragilis TaxID=817 RepID=UPI0021699476|nr:DUF4373 domain-containing protein [Bacteroides fragilis]
MAGRPTKQGIDYFPMDVGFFSDVKIRKISRACGSQSTSILICLLCNIYKDEGYYILWDEDLPFVIADTVGVSEGAVKEVLIKALQVGFFDNTLYEKYKILTSSGIQKRFLLATYQRKETTIIPEYLIDCTNNSINHANNSINNSDNEQSKVKVKRNKKESKETSTNVEAKKAEQAKKLAAAKAATLKRRDVFYQSLIPYVERYGKEMIRAFFDYWSELNKSETKMKFETNQTWEVAKRLATWANREKFNGKSSNSISITGTYTGGRVAQDKASSRQSLEDLADAILGQH